MPYKDLYLVRASTYLLAVVNYHVGQAAIVGYLYRVRRVPLLRASGWILFIIGINVGTLFLLASAGATRVTGELSDDALHPARLRHRHRRLRGALDVEAAHPGRATHPAAAVRDGHPRPRLRRAVRLPHICVLLVWHFVSLRMFGVQVTPGAALLYLPAYFAISSLPDHVNGIGVAQLVAVFFFAPYVNAPPGTGDPAARRRPSSPTASRRRASRSCCSSCSASSACAGRRRADSSRTGRAGRRSGGRLMANYGQPRRLNSVTIFMILHGARRRLLGVALLSRLLRRLVGRPPPQRGGVEDLSPQPPRASPAAPSSSRARRQDPRRHPQAGQRHRPRPRSSASTSTATTSPSPPTTTSSITHPDDQQAPRRCTSTRPRPADIKRVNWE